MISKLLLLEDLRFHIFTFVPLNCLLNSARYVNKLWAATIGSSHFAEAYERHAHSKLGLYVENCMEPDNSYFLEFKDYVNNQFERTDLGIPSIMGDIIDTCNGILLLCNIYEQIFVMNPILKCWLRIPDFPISRQPMIFSMQCTIAHVPGTSEFKLFLVDFVEGSDAFWYVFYVLRIGKDYTWNEIVRKEAPFRQLFLCRPLYSGDNDLYWITEKEVIVMNVDKEIIMREYPLPNELNILAKNCLMLGNRLSCIMSNDFNRTFQIYILNFDSGKLSLYHEMGPFDYVATCGHEVYIHLVRFCLWINNQIIFRVPQCQNQIGNTSPDIKNIHFGYNVNTRQLTKIGDIDVGHFEVCLHTNSLISLPRTPTLLRFFV